MGKGKAGNVYLQSSVPYTLKHFLAFGVLGAGDVMGDVMIDADSASLGDSDVMVM